MIKNSTSNNNSSINNNNDNNSNSNSNSNGNSNSTEPLHPACHVQASIMGALHLARRLRV